MQVSIDKEEGLKRFLTITVEAKEVNSKYDKAFKDASKHAKIDGFRKGHIPANILFQYFGQSITENALDDLVNETLYNATKEKDLRVAGQPRFELVDNKLPIRDQDFSYKVELEVFPEIEVKPVEELDVKSVTSEIVDSDVEELIDSLRHQRSVWQAKDGAAAADGCQVCLDYTGRIDGQEFEGGSAKAYQLIIGKSAMIPGFAEQIVGHKAGDEFTIKVTFPEDYGAEQLRGKAAEFESKLLSVSEEVLPEVNAEFFKAYGVKDGKEETFRAELRRNLDRELSGAVKAENRTRVIDALLKQYGEFDVPAASVEEEIDRLENLEVEQMVNMFHIKEKDARAFMEKRGSKREDRRGIATRNVRVTLVVQALLKSMDLREPDKEILDREIEEIASAYEKPDEYKRMIRSDRKAMANLRSMALDTTFITRVMAKAGKGEEHKSFKELVRKGQPA
ncbi:MAG: trigger factor [Succinivibrionaceae bacterium]|nr:trigger factor [Succinivibrionaceae bacterium]